MIELFKERGAIDYPRDFPEMKGEYFGKEKPGINAKAFAHEVGPSTMERGSSTVPAAIPAITPTTDGTDLDVAS